MCLIIAEAGENHLGDMKIARSLIDTAKEAGADYVKFQYYDAKDAADSDPEKEWFGKVQLDIPRLKELYGYARSREIKFLCTPWDAAKAEGLFSIGLKEIKIASFHITNREMLKAVNRKAATVFMSTGMSSAEEIDAAVQLLDRTDLYLLHCVSEYPLADNRVSLRTMDYLRKRYNLKTGYSDHSLGITACLAAVARGADVVEKHITMSKDYPGTDHVLSADPAELKTLVREARRIEAMLGAEAKTITKDELAIQGFLRNRFNPLRGDHE